MGFMVPSGEEFEKMKNDKETKQEKELETIKVNQQQIMKTLETIQSTLKSQPVAGNASNENLRAECEQAIREVQKEAMRFKEDAGKMLYEIKAKADEASQAVWASKALLIGLLVVSLGVNFGVGWAVYNNTNQMRDNYAATTAVLSEDGHYWFDGENFQISRKSPAQKDLENALKVYKQRQEQAARK